MFWWIFSDTDLEVENVQREVEVKIGIEREVEAEIDTRESHQRKTSIAILLTELYSF